MSDDFDWEQLRSIHLAESEERLGNMESALLDLERDPENTAAVESLRRDAHTLKGNAGIFGFDAISGIAHAFEDSLEAVRQSQASGRGAPAAVIGLLLQAVDALRKAFPSATAEQELTAEQTDLVARLRAKPALDSEAEPAPRAPRLTARPASGEEASPAPAATADEHRPARATLRVEAARVESLIELASEISIARGRIENVLSLANLPEVARDVLDETLPLLARLTDLALGMRLVPFGPIFAAHRRTARDAGLSLGREVRLETSGEEVEIDLALVDRVNEILLHIVRNAVAHGVEPPRVREAAGKPRVGTIRMSATAAAGQVLVDVSDDGSGLDLSAIRERARRLGIEPSGEDRLDAQLVFAPGLSTAAALSEISGRGVGLDSVKVAIERLAGSIEVRSEAGRGTHFLVRLPLTLAMIRGLFIAIGADRYVLPLDMVRECLDAPRDLDFGHDGVAMLARETHSFPVIRLGEKLLGNPGLLNRHLVVVSHAGNELGLVVDQVLGEGRVVVKPIGPALQGARSVFGAAILGDGYVALILDVADILSRLSSSGPRSESAAAGGPA